MQRTVVPPYPFSARRGNGIYSLDQIALACEATVKSSDGAKRQVLKSE